MKKSNYFIELIPEFKIDNRLEGIFLTIMSSYHELAICKCGHYCMAYYSECCNCNSEETCCLICREKD